MTHNAGAIRRSPVFPGSLGFKEWLRWKIWETIDSGAGRL